MLLGAFRLAPRVEHFILRFGSFPNVIHAEALIAHSLSCQGEGWSEQRLGPEVEVQWFIYSAGPSAIEAIFAGSLDVRYVNPSPALNANARSQREEGRNIPSKQIPPPDTGGFL